jgi:hypothetical protein
VEGCGIGVIAWLTMLKGTLSTASAPAAGRASGTVTVGATPAELKVRLNTTVTRFTLILQIKLILLRFA